MASEENFFNLSGINHLGEDFPDVSARRNYYNSSVEESIEEEVDITAEAEVEMIERTTCSCKGQCALKRGRGACSCRKEDLRCLALCKCDKSKCKNKDSLSEGNQRGPEVTPTPDGAVAFAASVEQSRQEIFEFVESLDHEKLVELLCKLLSMGRGSLDFARKAVAPGAPDHPSPPGGQPPWCQCHICRPMETEQENVCFSGFQFHSEKPNKIPGISITLILSE